jgi:predicted phage baseplate assembly protein
MNCYDRTATTVNANVGLATQGMSVTEILGSGQAYTPNQEFSLKQTPLTFVQAPTPTGRQSTLQVTANSVAWTEVPSLYQQPPSARVYATLNEPGGYTDILFGDGVEGATLPTGQINIQANYRIGSGLAGNVDAGSITTLIDRPLGVSAVNNPQAATGGQDPQSVDDIRANAPLSVLTLGRAVSITDYQTFSLSFAGIAKAYAIWIPSGPGRGVFITVAAAGGSALPAGNPTLDNLVTALHNYGNPLIPINAASFLETLFRFSADIKYDPTYDATAVKANVLAQLQQSYSFSARTFGEGVSSDEIAAFIQDVPGVIAVNVNSLALGPTSNAGDLASGGWSVTAYNNWLLGQVTLNRPDSGTPTRICAYLPVANPDGLPQPAEILVIDPNPKNVALGVLP